MTPSEKEKKEIGSEYWLTDSTEERAPVWERFSDGELFAEKEFYVSGRSALHGIISDVKKERECRTAYLPSYCCDSMVAPFLDHGMTVEFYSVIPDSGICSVIDERKKCDVVLTVDYFGYGSERCPLPEAVHIHDVTHSLLSGSCRNDADYIFGSLRKWGAVAGAGFAAKRKGSFLVHPERGEHRAFLELRRRGYSLKADYILKGEGEKSPFLDAFSSAEELLDEDYAGYAADADSLLQAEEIGACAEKRRENAKRLLAALGNLRCVTPIYGEVGEECVPLFVPVLVKDGKRDALRSFLIKNRVYCPVHWPRHSGLGGELYENELSLICDQRYGPDDMDRTAELITEFEERFC